MSRSKRQDFVRRFEGAQTLDGLLDLAGSPCDTREALSRMQEAHAQGLGSDEVIPSLFDGEPHFPSPDVARRLYQNLLGLWDLVQEGRNVRLEAPTPKVKKARPLPPTPFAPGEPDTAFVESAWRYLEDEEKARVRLMHAFENKQDGLLGVLDAAGLGDEGYALARHLLFELYAMLELGWPPGVASVAPKALEDVGTDALPVPEALAAYADEALFEAEHDEERPLPADELARVRTLARRGLAALWGARKGRENHGT